MSASTTAMIEVDGRVWLAEDPRLILIHLVIENAIDKLDIVQHLVSDGKRHDLHNDTISGILKQRQRLESEYQTRMRSRTCILDWNRKNITEDAQATQILIQRLRHLDQAMQKHVRREMAASTAAVLKMRREKIRALNILQKAVKELESIGRCDSLGAVLADEMQHQVMVEEAVTQSRELAESCGQLERQIEEESAQFDTELQTKMKQIQLLRDELAQLNGSMESEQSMAEMEGRAQIHTQTRLVQICLNQTENIVSNADHQLNTHIKALEFTEIYLKRKLDMAERQLADWVRRRQDEEAQAVRRLEQIRLDREAQLDEIETLREIIDKEQTARDIRIETDRRTAERQRRRMEAVLRIQARIRGFLVRNRIKKSKQSGKKGKKGDKSKKKKK